VSFAKVMPGSLCRISVTIFWTVAASHQTCIHRNTRLEFTYPLAATDRRYLRTRDQTWWVQCAGCLRRREGRRWELLEL
jgi:hypothetical protein